MPPPGERAVIVANHVSFLDGVLLAGFLPGRPTFAINTQIAQTLVGEAGARRCSTPSRSTRPTRWRPKRWSARSQAGRHCVIFPEGRITVTGALMKVFDGPGMVADKADAPIMPVRIDGAQFTPLLAPAAARCGCAGSPRSRSPSCRRAARGRAGPASGARAARRSGIEALRRDERYDLRDLELPPHPVRGAAARRATSMAARKPDRRGHQARAAELRPPDRRQLRAGPRHRPADASRARRSACCCPTPPARRSPSSRCRPMAACRRCSTSPPGLPTCRRPASAAELRDRS